VVLLEEGIDGGVERGEGRPQRGSGASVAAEIERLQPRPEHAGLHLGEEEGDPAPEGRGESRACRLKICCWLGGN
jgi:hypothetical protein